ncbi:MAG: Calx-beta domain-containing protein, partial [Acidobacteriota bacterium]
CNLFNGPGGYPPRLRSKLASNDLDVDMDSRGACSERTSQGVTRLRNLLEQEPDVDVVLIMEGTNDINNGIGVESILFNLDRMAEVAELAGVEPVMASVVPFGPDEMGGDDDNVAARDLADELRVASMEADRFFADPYYELFNRSNYFDNYFFDRLHPNSAGYNLVAESFVEASLGAAEATQPGRLELAETELEVNEEDGSVTFTVNRVAGAEGVVEVTYATIDGSAIAGDDYEAANGTLTWADGDAEPKTFDVSIIDDAEEENPETLEVNLQDPTGGATLGTPSTASLTINDDDAAPNTCIADEDTLCLNAGGRFRAEVVWRTRDDNTGVGKAFDIGQQDSGLFYFFNPNNIEMLVKVLDACSLEFNSFWVFFAATTDVEFTLTITDLVSGQSKVYFNPLDQPANAVTDTEGFDTCP